MVMLVEKFSNCCDYFVRLYYKIITVKTVLLYKKLQFFIKSLKSKKKKLAITLLYCVR